MVWDDPATTSFKQKLGKRVAIRARDTCELSLGKEAHACREPSAYILLASTESIATASCKLSREIAKSSIILQEGKNSYQEKLNLKWNKGGNRIFWTGKHIKELERLWSDGVLPGYLFEPVCPSKNEEDHSVLNSSQCLWWQVKYNNEFISTLKIILHKYEILFLKVLNDLLNIDSILPE